MAVRHKPPTTEAQVRFQVIPCGMSGGRFGTEIGFPPKRVLIFRKDILHRGRDLKLELTKIIHKIYIYIYIYALNITENILRTVKDTTSNYCGITFKCYSNLHSTLSLFKG